MNHIFADEEILTREEVMDVLKIGRSTFYKLLQSGNLKGIKPYLQHNEKIESVFP